MTRYRSGYQPLPWTPPCPSAPPCRSGWSPTSGRPTGSRGGRPAGGGGTDGLAGDRRPGRDGRCGGAGYASQAGQAIRACNAYLDGGRKAAMVLTCRIGQYEALEQAREWVHDAARVQLRPVTVPTAGEFLGRLGPLTRRGGSRFWTSCAASPAGR